MTRLGRWLRQKAADLITHLPVQSNSWLGGIIHEPFAGAWQRNLPLDRGSIVTYSTVWACVTLISADIAKLWIKLTVTDDDGISSETESPAFSPVLRKPNAYSTRVKFLEYWMISKFTHGNTYVLKERDNRRVVVALYILDPTRVTVLIAPDGSVFYQLAADNLAGVGQQGVTVPASEIIHDICVPLHHPLVGVSPLAACWLAATMGIKGQQQAADSFAKGLQLAGVITAPGIISNEASERIREWWQTHMMGEANRHKVAVLGDGMKFDALEGTARDAQLAEQMKMANEQICSVYKVPPYMVGVGPVPAYTNVQALNLQYYSQCLQNPIENLELLLEEGLELPKSYHVEMDLEALLRMDTATLTAVLKDQVSAGITSPNEARAAFDRKAVEGGETPYLQEQNWPLKMLAARELPTRPPTAPAELPPAPTEVAEEVVEDEDEKAFVEAAAILMFQVKAAALGLPTQKAA